MNTIGNLIRKLNTHLLRHPMFYSSMASLALLLLCSDEAWGRAGGGRSFGGGGGGRSYGGGSWGGSHSSGGGGGSFEIIGVYYLLRYLIWQNPVLGIPVLIIAGYLSYRSLKQANDSYTGNTIRKGSQRNIRAVHERALKKVSDVDPAFSMEQFTGRVSGAFNKAQLSWCAQNISPIRPFVSDGIYERWDLQLLNQKNSGIRDQMDDITVISVLLDNYEVCGDTEELTVRINASARDYTLSLKTGKKISGSKSVEVFTEYWTFLRRKGAKSLQGKDGLMEGNCPNCGSKVGINQSAKCEHCGAFLRSGLYDWVLTEITQESVYTASSSANLPGLGTIQQEDPQLSPRMVEDRASVIFWRWAFALQEQKVDKIRGCCGEDFVKQTTGSIQKHPGHFFINCAVGAVDLLGLIKKDGYNQAVVEVTWSGQKAAKQKSGKLTKFDKCIYRRLYVLQRKNGVKSVKTNEIGSAHCPGCGAPEQANDAGKCSFCGFLLNDGSNQWILQDIYNYNSAAGREVLAQLREQRIHSALAAQVTSSESEEPAPAAQDNPEAGFNMSAYALMAWLCKLAASDNEVTPGEKQMLLSAAKARNLPSDIVDHMVEAALNGTLEAPEPEDLQQAKLWLQYMARIALADGKITNEETEMLLAAGQKLNFTPADIRKIINQQRKELYQQAKGRK